MNNLATNTITLEYPDHDALDHLAEQLDGTLIRTAHGDTLLTLPLEGLHAGRFLMTAWQVAPTARRAIIRPTSVRVPARLASSPLARPDAWAF